MQHFETVLVTPVFGAMRRKIVVSHGDGRVLPEFPEEE